MLTSLLRKQRTIVCVESRRLTNPKRTGNRCAKATGVEARLGMNVNRGGNGGLLGDGRDDKKALSCRNETRLEYSSRFCAAISVSHLSLTARPPLRNEERRSPLGEIALGAGPEPIIAAAQIRLTELFFSLNILDKGISPTL